MHILSIFMRTRDNQTQINYAHKYTNKYQANYNQTKFKNNH